MAFLGSRRPLASKLASCTCARGGYAGGADFGTGSCLGLELPKANIEKKPEDCAGAAGRAGGGGSAIVLSVVTRRSAWSGAGVGEGGVAAGRG
jgi:hypothetical protein